MTYLLLTRVYVRPNQDRLSAGPMRVKKLRVLSFTGPHATDMLPVA